MQSVRLNPINTALGFEPGAPSSPRRCQSTTHTYNLLMCQKQRHEEKTIQSCIIPAGDEGAEATLSGTGGTPLCWGTARHFKPPRQLHYFRRFLLEITSVSSHHLWQQPAVAEKQHNTPRVNTRKWQPAPPAALASTSPDNEVGPHQLSITRDAGAEIELKESHGWPQDTKRYCSWQPHSIHSSLK